MAEVTATNRFSTMDIYSAPGTKIKFAHPNSGYTHDQKQCAEYLTLGGIYTVKRTDVHSSHTYVYLEEVPGQHFNSVMFDAVTDEASRVLEVIEQKPILVSDHEILHTLWTKAVGTPNYNKREWKELEAAVSPRPPWDCVMENPFSKGYKHRNGRPVSDACGDGRHSECNQDLTKCACTYRGDHTTMHAYASPAQVKALINKEK